ncbi:MAG: glycerol dehydrogenase [Eubacterium sp.]|nr:glycerol dehydrogenase [Eubacterium sp.]
MSKVICSPGCYVQGKGEMQRLADYCSKIGAKAAYLLIDQFIYDTYKEQIISSFEAEGFAYTIGIFGGECSENEIQRHKMALGQAGVIIGIGGGKTLDTAKAIAFYTSISIIVVPTAASTDAPCSRLSVVYTDSGTFDHYLPLNKNPDIVIMDTEIIAKAPVRFLMAGIGDALATYYEAAACEQSNAVTMAGGHITKAAFTLAKLSLETLLEDGIKAKLAAEQGVTSKALENIVEASTYLSGIGFESSGLAAAHAIHNGLTVLEETHHLLHGEKVVFGTICQMVLENRPMEEIRVIVDFCKRCNLPTTFKAMGMDQVSDEKLMAVAVASCAEDDTMGNMPFVVEPEDIVAAMKIADQIA